MKKRFLGGVLLILCAAGAAHAANGRSSKFDGVYETSAEMVPWMSSSPSCLALTAGDIRIRGGVVSSLMRDVPGAVRGIITGEGYLQASIVLVPPETTVLSGRLYAGQLTAGAIDDKSGCAWLVKLTPRRMPRHGG